ncbi:MAG: FkbM family methyltransferase [Pelagibacterales bacterium]|nr:FkbM family methyltransferase [Pelagibacterales bacterium]
MFFEKIINFFDFFHQSRITKYLKKLKIEYFIDVGAHKGEFLRYLSKLNHKKIYVFEPQKEIFKILAKNFKGNKKIKFFNIALADKNSKKTFYINKLSLTSTFSVNKKTLFSKIKNLILNSKNSYIDKYLVKTKKLDEILYNQKIENSFLKIDVEGFEFNVLKGAKKLISNKVRYILVERQFFQLYEDYSPDKVELFLKRNNFRLLKKFTFPLLHFQDNLYIKKDFKYLKSKK